MPSTSRTSTAVRRAQTQTSVETVEEVNPGTQQGSVNLETDYNTFRRWYKQARHAFKQRSNPLEEFLLTAGDNPPNGITRGRKPSDTGRGGFKYGIELEYIGSHNPEFGRWLYNQGLSHSSTLRPYHSSRDYSKWRWERDATVSGEVISRILKDERDHWKELNSLVGSMKTMLNATADTRVGAHIHVDSSGMNNRAWFNLGLLVSRFEDVLYRVGSNPLRRELPQNTDALPRLFHRGTSYTGPVANHIDYWLETNPRPGAGFTRDFKSARGMINNQNVAVRGNSGHIEFRFWDGSIDMSIIELQIKVTAAIMTAVLDESLTDKLLALDPCPYGTHRARRSEISRDEQGRSRARTNLTGEQWKQDNLRFRQFVDTIFVSDEDKRQLVTLFAMTSW